MQLSAAEEHFIYLYSARTSAVAAGVLLSVLKRSFVPCRACSAISFAAVLMARAPSALIPLIRSR